MVLNGDNASYTVAGIGSCTDTDVVIPSEYNGLPVTSISNQAFFECDSLTSVIIPDSVTTIGSSAFYGCEKLTSIVIPDSVTSIDRSAFSGCTSLASIVIPDSVTEIGYEAFYNCSSLTTVYYTGSEAEWEQIEIGYNNDDLLEAEIVFNYKGE